MQGKQLAEIITKQGFSGTAALYMDNAYGQGVAKVFMEEFRKLGGKIALDQMFNENSIDFRAELLKIKESGADSMLLVAYQKPAQIILKQMSELGLETRIFSTDTFEDQVILDEVGGLAEGIIFTVFFEPDSEKASDFRERYFERYGKEAGVFSDYAYDSVYVMKEGIEKAGSLDVEAVRKALYEIRYEGATGLTVFDSFGEANKPYGAMEVKNGEFVEYKG